MISMIWAMGRDNALGCKNRMPWHIPADFAYFKKVTMGKPVIMGRKTFESIGKPLPGRKNIIITGNKAFEAQGCSIAGSAEEAIALAGEEEAFVIGGAEIYRAFLPSADNLYITQIDETFEADTFFPELDYSQWEMVSSLPGVRDEKNPYDYRFLVFKRKS